MACFCTGACRTTGRCSAAEGLNYGFAESVAYPDQPLGMHPKAVQDLIDQLTKEKQPVEETKPAEPHEAPGFHPVDGPKFCTSYEHNLPTHLYIPPGMKYVHYCPACGQKTVAYGNNVWC